MASVKTCFRLGMGTKRSGPRPVKVVFHSVMDRQSILRSARDLSKLEDTHAFRRVYIRPDLTPAQLLEDKKLREEVRMRRSAGEDVILRNGKIVSQSSFHRRFRAQ